MSVLLITISAEYISSSPNHTKYFQDITDRDCQRNGYLGSRLCCVIGLTRKKIELRRGDIDFRCADSLGLFNVFS